MTRAATTVLSTRATAQDATLLQSFALTSLFQHMHRRGLNPADYTFQVKFYDGDVDGRASVLARVAALPESGNIIWYTGFPDGSFREY